VPSVTCKIVILTMSNAPGGQFGNSAVMMAKDGPAPNRRR
jgi:hypothetical protein